MGQITFCIFALFFVVMPTCACATQGGAAPAAMTPVSSEKRSETPNGLIATEPQAAPQPNATAPANPAAEPPRFAPYEIEYSNKYKEKVEKESEKAKSSLSALYKAMATVMICLLILGLYTVFRLNKQQKELDALKGGGGK